jgi:hypothetical protein
MAKQSKYKGYGKGWHFESYRHSLSAKGIRTKNRLSSVGLNKLMQERVRNLPIYVREGGTGAGQEKIKKYAHVLSKDAPHEVRQRVLSLIKHYPTILTDIEKSSPEGILFTKEPIRIMAEDYAEHGITKSMIKKDHHPPLGVFHEEGQFVPKKGLTAGGVIVIPLTNVPHQKKMDTKYGQIQRQQGARVITHELKHARQYEKYGDTPLYDKLFKGNYKKQKGEIQARKEEERIKRLYAPIEEERVFRQARTTPETEEFSKQRLAKIEKKEMEKVTPFFQKYF